MPHNALSAKNVEYKLYYRMWIPNWIQKRYGINICRYTVSLKVKSRWVGR